MAQKYNMYKIKIRLMSALVTPLMADTIWGHICYGILFNEGEEKLNEFLNGYKNADANFSPPLVLSTPFPQGMIPLPKLLHEKEEEMNLEKYNKIKRKKSIKFIPVEKLMTNERINISEFLEEQLENENQGKNASYKKDTRIRNSIDRLLGTTSEDSIFQVEEIWYPNFYEVNHNKVYQDIIFDIYVLSIYDKERTKKLFKMGFSLGYGADASTGKGKIEVLDEIEDFNFPKDGNIGIALAPFVPAKNEYENFGKTRGLFADTWTKYPKVHNSNPKMTNPFKKPIVFYKEGATFDFENISNNEKPLFIGRCLDKIHHLPEIMQYAIAPIFWLNLE